MSTPLWFLRYLLLYRDHPVEIDLVIAAVITYIMVIAVIDLVIIKNLLRSEPTVKTLQRSLQILGMWFF